MARAARELQRYNICGKFSKATRLVEVPEFGLLYLFLARYRKGLCTLQIAHASLDVGDGPCSFACFSHQSYEFLEDRLVLNFRGLLPVEEKCCH